MTAPEALVQALGERAKKEDRGVILLVDQIEDRAHSSGLALEVSLGYLAAVSALHRTVNNAYFFDKNPAERIPLTYDLEPPRRTARYVRAGSR